MRPCGRDSKRLRGESNEAICNGIVLLSLLSSLAFGQESNDFHPAETNVWGAEYPRVDSAGRVQIRVKAPDATKVKVEFLEWAESGYGEAAGRILDGHHNSSCSRPALLHIDHRRRGSQPIPTVMRYFGGGKYASAVEVPEPGSTYYSIQDVPHGQVREVWYNSKVTGTWRHALVYLPPNYDAQTKVRYPGALSPAWWRRG